jgi:hypothetical protein
VQEFDLGSHSRGDRDGLESVSFSYNKTCPYEYGEEKEDFVAGNKILYYGVHQAAGFAEPILSPSFGAFV